MDEETLIFRRMIRLMKMQTDDRKDYRVMRDCVALGIRLSDVFPDPYVPGTCYQVYRYTPPDVQYVAILSEN